MVFIYSKDNKIPNALTFLLLLSHGLLFVECPLDLSILAVRGQPLFTGEHLLNAGRGAEHNDLFQEPPRPHPTVIMPNLQTLYRTQQRLEVDVEDLGSVSLKTAIIQPDLAARLLVRSALYHDEDSGICPCVFLVPSHYSDHVWHTCSKPKNKIHFKIY